MTIKFHRTDDGSVIEGKTVVFLSALVAQAAPVVPARSVAHASEQQAAGAAQAAALVAAAKDGVPFCEECDKARRKLAGK